MWYSPEAVRRWTESLLHTHDTPERTALAFALGVFLGFSPFVGFHLAAGVVLALLFNLNRIALISGVCLNLPWVMGPYYAATTALGTWLVGAEVPPNLLKQLRLIWEIPHWRERADALGALLQPLLLPFTLGSLLGALVLGAIAYKLSLTLILSRRRRLERSSGNQRVVDNWR